MTVKNREWKCMHNQKLKSYRKERLDEMTNGELSSEELILIYTETISPRSTLVETKPFTRLRFLLHIANMLP